MAQPSRPRRSGSLDHQLDRKILASLRTAGRPDQVGMRARLHLLAGATLRPPSRLRRHHAAGRTGTASRAWPKWPFPDPLRFDQQKTRESRADPAAAHARRVDSILSAVPLAAGPRSRQGSGERREPRRTGQGHGDFRDEKLASRTSRVIALRAWDARSISAVGVGSHSCCRGTPQRVRTSHRSGEFPVRKRLRRGGGFRCTPP